MTMIWGGNRSAWDFGNPDNWVINKSIGQNWNEFATGTQVIALAFPSATWGAYPGAAVRAGAAAASGAGSAASAAGAGAAAAGGAAAAIPAALKVAEKGLDLTILTSLGAWLTKYWWIPTIFIGLWTVGKFGGK